MKIPKGPGLFAATVGISAAVTAGFDWVSALAGWTLVGVTRCLPIREKEMGMFSAAVTLILGMILICGAAVASETAFPGDDTFPFVSLGLYLLLYFSLEGKRGDGTVVSNVIGLVLALMFSVLLFFGVENIQWEEIKPKGLLLRQIALTAAVASPWCWDRDTKDGKWLLAGGVYSVAISLVTRGILGGNLAEYSSVPFYEAVQTIHILGTLQRMEALLASGILLGSFAMMQILGERMYRAGKYLIPDRRERQWLIPTLIVSFLLECGYFLLDNSGKAVINTAFWGVAVLSIPWMVFFRKISKNEK